jgi:hypothetical protein
MLHARRRTKRQVSLVALRRNKDERKRERLFDGGEVFVGERGGGKGVEGRGDDGGDGVCGVVNVGGRGGGERGNELLERLREWNEEALAFVDSRGKKTEVK